MTEPEEFRPRYGRVLRADGTTRVVYFRPAPDQPGIFEPVDPETEKVIELGAGDTIAFDRLGAHQGIRVMRDDNQTEGRTRPGWRNTMEENLDQSRGKRDTSWSALAKGLVTLFALGGFIVGLVWAINAVLT